MKLKTTAMEYVYSGEDGYSFTVTANHDPETGWSAHVSMATHGGVAPEDSIKHLRHSAEAFLRALDAMEGGKK